MEAVGDFAVQPANDLMLKPANAATAKGDRFGKASLTHQLVDGRSGEPGHGNDLI